ncbi:hypothetical protein [Periweissella ghanensis]|uniref:Uncharacterized protein n=1 Tax=Periweissella ghanensis TaxID=467997 RepID=A0ABM8ZBZ6_9LACO|nr:hypothetical protein [Periweissella ghanensis]MCM0601821.1 hypothetical protein [Periweissella ghanensis]CAH0418808.1 hypothetical protein WGH24286_01250 [Periweissella ghanensis]
MGKVIPRSTIIDVLTQNKLADETTQIIEATIGQKQFMVAFSQNGVAMLRLNENGTLTGEIRFLGVQDIEELQFAQGWLNYKMFIKSFGGRRIKLAIKRRQEDYPEQAPEFEAIMHRYQPGY